MAINYNSQRDASVTNPLRRWQGKARATRGFMLQCFWLGKSKIVIDGVQWSEAPARVVALLALLTLNGPITRSSLATLFWGEQAEAAARRNLRIFLHRLKPTPIAEHLDLGAEVVAIAGDCWCDASDIASSVTTGVGHFLDGLYFEATPDLQRWIEEQRARLNQLQTEALFDEIKHHKNQQQWLAALDSCQKALTLNQLQESLQYQALWLRMRLGQFQAASEAFDRFQTELGQRLGLTPLADQLTLAARAEQLAANARADDALGAFVGRQALLGQMALSNASLLVISGASGLGKTRLLRRYCGAGTGFWWSFAPEAKENALYCLVAAFRGHPHYQQLRQLPALWRQPLLRLLPELAQVGEQTAGGSLATGLQISQSSDQGHFWRAISEAILFLVGAGTIAIDNLHWSDESSNIIITDLLQRLKQRQTPLADQPMPQVVITMHDLELGDDDHLRPFWRALLRQHAPEVVALSSFSPSETAELVEQQLYLQKHLQHLQQPAQQQYLSEYIQQTTAGHPLYSVELLYHLLSQPADWPSGEAGPARLGPLPERLLQLAHSRLVGLPATTLQLLQAASLCPYDFELEDVAAAAELDDWSALAALEQALGQRLLRAEPPTSYRFSHQVLQQSLQQQVGAGPAAAQRHAAIAQALAARAGDPLQIANHWQQAGRTEQAAIYWGQAAAQAAEVYAYREALNHYQRALDHSQDGQMCCRYHLARAMIWQALGESNQAESALQAALAAFAALTPPLPGLLIDIKLAQMTLWQGADQQPQVIEISQQISDDPAASANQRLRARLAQAEATLALGDPRQAEQLLQQAQAEAADQPDELRAQLVNGLAVCAFYRADFLQAAAFLAETTALLAHSPKRSLLARATIHQGVVAQALGNQQQAAAHLQTGLAMSREIGHLHLQCRGLFGLIKLFTDQGDAAQAWPLVIEGLALVNKNNNPHEYTEFLQARHYCQMLLGELGQAIETMQAMDQLSNDPALDVYHKVGSWLLPLPLLAYIADWTQFEARLSAAKNTLVGLNIAYNNNEIACGEAWLALHHHNSAQALAILAEVAPAKQPGEDLQRLRLLALAHQQTGATPTALALLADCQPSVPLDTWLTVLALRLEVQVELSGTMTEAMTKAMTEAMTADLQLAEHYLAEHIPALPRLALASASAKAALCLGQHGLAAAMRALAHNSREQLAEHLGTYS
jgi:DNA-binding SARP family transcriptional activator